MYGKLMQFFADARRLKLVSASKEVLAIPAIGLGGKCPSPSVVHVHVVALERQALDTVGSRSSVLPIGRCEEGSISLPRYPRRQSKVRILFVTATTESAKPWEPRCLHSTLIPPSQT